MDAPPYDARGGSSLDGLVFSAAPLQGDRRSAEEAGALKTLIYQGASFDARLGYHPKTNTPVNHVRQNQELGMFTEIYPELTLKPDLPDELFRRPEEQSSGPSVLPVRRLKGFKGQ